MPALTYQDGFPDQWGNPSPQKPGTIPGGQIGNMIQDIRINQIPRGRADQIPIVQTPRPRQAPAQGVGIDPSQNVGSFGSNLYDAFMIPIVGETSKGGA